MTTRNALRFVSRALCGTFGLGAVTPDVPRLENIRTLVAEAKRKLGDKAGMPEVADTFTAVPRDARWLTPAGARTTYAQRQPQLEKLRWWKPELDPTKLTPALRELAAEIDWAVPLLRRGTQKISLPSAGRRIVLARAHRTQERPAPGSPAAPKSENDGMTKSRR